MTSQPRYQAIVMHILLNVLRSKSNQKMKLIQLIECNIINIFYENHTQNVVEKLFPDPFLKNQNCAYLWIISLKFNTTCFYCMLR